MIQACSQRSKNILRVGNLKHITTSNFFDYRAHVFHRFTEVPSISNTQRNQKHTMERRQRVETGRRVQENLERLLLICQRHFGVCFGGKLPSTRVTHSFIHGPLPKHHRDRVTEEGTRATRFCIWKTDGRRMTASSGCRKATASTLREESLLTG